MSDKLSDFVNNNREDFEVYDFNVKEGWQELEEQLSPAKSKRQLIIWKSIAASVTILLLAAVGVIILQQSQAIQLPQELIEAQYYYQQQIDYKLELVRQQSGSAEYVTDLGTLDEAFEELKADLKDDVHNEAVVTAMIDNYRLKLRILEEILEELEEKENESYPNI
jgi:hypothetical protein